MESKIIRKKWKNVIAWNLLKKVISSKIFSQNDICSENYRNTLNAKVSRKTTAFEKTSDHFATIGCKEFSLRKPKTFEERKFFDELCAVVMQKWVTCNQWDLGFPLSIIFFFLTYSTILFLSCNSLNCCLCNLTGQIRTGMQLKLMDITYSI